MKPIAEVTAAIERRLQNTWNLTAIGDTGPWPYQFPLGRPTSNDLLHNFGRVQQWAFTWSDWATAHSLDLAWGGRKSGSTHQELPTHLVVPNADAAAAVAGHGWPQRLNRGRARYQQLAAQFPDAPLAKVVRDVDGWSQVDFDLLMVAAHWFQVNPASGRSPRQVPIEGMHSKWLNTHKPQVAALAGLDDLGLIEPRTTAIAFTYLDPEHRATGARLHDSVIPGDRVQPAYAPQVVIITENKDTAILFPQVPEAITVQGGGKAGPALISQIGWMRDAAHVIYWGDLDADGFEIVNSYRERGVPVRTILMDLAAVDGYRQFATAVDAKGQPLRRSDRRPLPHLTCPERTAYEAITDTSRDWPIRIEQERIPLYEALSVVSSLLPPRSSVDALSGHPLVY